MNEIKLIHLGRTAFTIAVDAHADLRNYLAAIKKYAEIDVIEEVEIRMAELLSERGFDEKKVVLKSDIEYLKSQLGEPEDFTDAGEKEDHKRSSESNEETQDAARRLYRDTGEGWLGGVASGLAAYVGIAPWLVRLAFILLTFAWGTSILLYIILWILLPDAKTPSDRLHMQGKPVTVDTIKELVNKNSIKSGVEDIKSAAQSIGNGTWHETSRGTRFGNAMASLIKVALAAFGAVLMIGAIIGIFVTIAFGSYAITNSTILFGGMEFFPIGTAETWMAILAITVVSLMGVLVALAGLSLVREKWPAPGWLTGSIVAIILVGITAGIPMAGSMVPKIQDRYDAAHKTTTRQLEQFAALVVAGEYTRVTYEPSNSYEVIIKSVGKVDLSRVTTQIVDKKLTVAAYEYNKQTDCGLFCININDVTITVKSPMIDRVEVQDGANFVSEEQLNQSMLSVISDDSSYIRMNYINAQKVSLFEEGGQHGITLEGLLSANQYDTFNNYDYFSISRAQDVVYNQQATCSTESPYLQLLNNPSSITIGSNVYKNIDDYRNDRQKETDNQSKLNCISVPILE